MQNELPGAQHGAERPAQGEPEGAKGSGEPRPGVLLQKLSLNVAATYADSLACMARSIKDNDVPPALFELFARACRALEAIRTLGRSERVTAGEVLDLIDRECAGIWEPEPTPRSFIQWKGTDVCIDLWCTCGTRLHFDGSHLYAWKCPHCSACWQMADRVAMTKCDADHPSMQALRYYWEKP